MTRTLFQAMAFAALTVCFCLAGPAAASAQTPPPAPAPFERYGHIERFNLASKATGKTYKIEIWFPASYAASTRTYPALFVLDGNYAFDSAVSISSYMQRGEIAEHIIVGISGDVPFGDALGRFRTPDYTPPLKDGVVTRDPPGPFYRFLHDELAPQVQTKARIDPDQKTLWGYSLSGSFLAWLNMYDHALFRNYIAASPNWGQFGMQQKLIEGAIFNAPGVDHKLFMSFDLSELQGIPEPEAAVRAFVDAGMPGYKAGYVMTRGETHTTSWFATLPTALRFIYGPAPAAP